MREICKIVMSKTSCAMSIVLNIVQIHTLQSKWLFYIPKWFCLDYSIGLRGWNNYAHASCIISFFQAIRKINVCSSITSSPKNQSWPYGQSWPLGWFPRSFQWACHQTLFSIRSMSKKKTLISRNIQFIAELRLKHPGLWQCYKRRESLITDIYTHFILWLG